MEELVKDTLLEGKSSDRVLVVLLELATKYLKGEPVFPDALEAPDFFTRTFCVWVREGLEEVTKLNQAEAGAPPTPSA